MDYFDYVCTYIPTGCTQYVVGNTYPFFVVDPPPAEHLVTGTTNCAGARFTLAPDP